MIRELIKKKKYKFKIITGKPYYNYTSNDEINLRLFEGQKVFRISAIKPNNKNFLNIFLNYFTYILNTLIFSLKLIMYKSNCNFVFATSPLYQSFPAIFISKIKKIPTIIWVQDLWPEVLEDHGYKNKILIFFLRVLTKYIYKSSHVILVQNIEFKKYLTVKYNLNNIRVLHNPSPYKFQNSYNYSVKNKIFKFAYAGNIGESQNLISVCKVLKNINYDFKFYIIGDGSEKNNLKNYIEKIKLKKKIILKDHMSSNRLRLYLKKMDGLFISLKTGKSLSKTLPGKLSMYLSFGKPILSFAPGAVNSFINKHNLGISSNNIKDFESKFDNFYKTTKKQKKFYYGNCYKTYKLFFEDIKILKVLEKTLNEIN